MSAVAVDADTTLDYAVFGDPSAEPLLMICGTAQSYPLWAGLAKVFATNGYHVICYDHRGMGRSTRGRREITTASLASDADALLGALAIRKAHVLGWSLGSATAQRLALAHPDRVGALVLYATWDHVDSFQRAVIAGLRAGWVAAHRAEAITALGIAFTPEMVNSANFATMMAKSSTTFPATDSQIRTTVEQWDADLAHDTRGQLGSISCPTLVVAAERDLLTPVWQGQAVAAAIPGAQLHTFTGAGASHAVAFERTAEFVGLVLAFLAAHPCS